MVCGLKRQADVVFGERAQGAFRGEEVVELGLLQVFIKGALGGEIVQKPRHPP